MTVDVRSVNFIPLVMEAHQFLAAAIPLACCREIQVAMLRSIGLELSAAADGPAALMAVGVLVQRLEADQRAARDAFARRFGAFASRRQRKQMGDTFA